MPHERSRHVLPALLALFFLFAYVASASRHVLGGDCGEFALIYAEGGIAHPSGYPLYTAWLRLFAWIPTPSPAWGASIATAILGTAGALLLHAAARGWGASRSGAATAACLFAFSPLMWTQSTQPEVFALHALLANAILWICGPRHGVSSGVRAAMLGLLAGAGLSNNHSIVLLAPLGLFAAWETVRDARHRGRVVALGLAGLALGLAPHLLLPLWAEPAPDRWQWGDPSTWSGFWHHVLRRDFGTFSLGLYDGESLVLDQQLALARSLLTNTLWVGAAFALAGHTLLARRAWNDGPRERARWLAFAASALLAGPVFTSLFNLAPEGLGRLIIERFHLLPLALFSFGTAFAVDALRRRLRLQRDLVVIPVVATLAFGVMFGLPDVRDGHRPTLELYARNVLESLPPDAVLLGTGDHRLFAFEWARRIEGVRPDVVYVDGSLVLYPWYAARAERALGVSLLGISHADHSVATPDLISGLQAQGRPVFIANRYTPSIARAHRLVPWGAVHRVLEHDEVGPDIPSVTASNRALLAEYEIETQAPGARDLWSHIIYQDYARPWLELALAWEGIGRPDVAATYRDLAEQLDPGPRR